MAAARIGDEKALLVVFGRGGEDIISSGDKVADDALYARFIAFYDAKHQITMQGDRKAILVIGDTDYPFPIPLLRVKGKWSFDTETGRREILYRRIGRNELDTIEVCLAYVDAQTEYADKDRTGAGVGVYAQRFISEPGKKNGLYWPKATGEEDSPLGEFFAKASSQGYRTDQGRSPYHGYYYKILTSQGPAAPGGAAHYIVGGKMIGGFALVAYPAEYRNSGVMTFIVSHADIGVSKRSWAEYCRDRRSYDGVQSGPNLAKSRRKLRPQIEMPQPLLLRSIGTVMLRKELRRLLSRQFASRPKTTEDRARQL